MDEALFRLTRDHRDRLQIVFADCVRVSEITEFLAKECGAKPVRTLEDPLGDFYDIDFRIGFSTVCLASDNWTVMLTSNSRWSDRAIRKIAARLRNWQPPT